MTVAICPKLMIGRITMFGAPRLNRRKSRKQANIVTRMATVWAMEPAISPMSLGHS